MRFPVQHVIRPDSTFRGFAGQIAEGEIRTGDRVVALPSGQTTRVRSIVTFDGKLEAAERGQSISCRTRRRNRHQPRRNAGLARRASPKSRSTFEAALVWMNEKPLEIGHTYLVKHTTRQVKARVTVIRHRIDVNTLAQEPASDLQMNGIAVVEIETSNPLFFDPYEQSRVTGSFILIDALSNATVAAGMIRRDFSQQAANRASHEPHATIASGKTVSRPTRSSSATVITPASSYCRPRLSPPPNAPSSTTASKQSPGRSRIPSASIATVLDSLRSVGLNRAPGRRTSRPRNAIAALAAQPAKPSSTIPSHQKTNANKSPKSFPTPKPCASPRSSAIQRQTKNDHNTQS